MRRALAILALVVTSWPHVVVLECALGSTASPGGAEPTRHDAPSRATTHHRPEHRHALEQGPGADQGVPADGAPCASVMVCGLVMIRAEGQTFAEASPGVPDAGPRSCLEAPSGVAPLADPPPPRRHA